MNISIERVIQATPDVHDLIGELNDVLNAAYEPDQRHGLSIEQLFEPNMRFFLVRLENLAVGCGSVALFDDYAEVKRMYTRSAVRRLGLAKALLRRIEEEARTAACLCCESKPASINGRPSASMKLRAFGHAARSDPMQRCPAHKIETSLFFEKEL